MGDPRKIRSKYSGPKHPWQRSRIDEEKEIVKKYAPKNKNEIWKMDSKLDIFKQQAKKLSSLKTKQAEREEKQLLKKLVTLGLLKEGDNLASILVLKREDIMERRLQTLVFRKAIVRSIAQARQFITHGHIAVGDKVITSPSYLVLKNEENAIRFQEDSSFTSEDHPERQVAKPVVAPKEEVKTEKKEEKKEAKKERKEKKAKSE